MMLKLLKSLLGALSERRSYLTLLIVAGAAAWLYVQFATVRADRDVLDGLARQFCTAAGSELQPAGAAASARGSACRSAIIRLAAYERDSQVETAKTLIDAMHERDRKQLADVSTATAAATEAQAAAQNMEKVNASVGPDDRVDGAWFAALNRLARLRAPGS